MSFPSYSSRVLWSKWLLTCAALVGCLIGFGLIVEDQFLKFINRKTGVSVSYELKEKHKTPNIAFCDHASFKANATWADLTDPTTYESILNIPEVEFKGIAEYEFASKSKFSYKWTYVDTVFNGRCKEFVPMDDLMAYDYLSFQVISGAVDLYVIQPGEEFFLLWQNWGFSSASGLMNLNENSVLSLEAASYLFLKDRNSGLNCGYRKENDYRFYTDCLRQYLDDGLEEFDCLPLLLVNHTSRYRKRICGINEKTVSDAAVLRSSKPVADGHCKISCYAMAYSVKQTTYTLLPGGPANKREGFEIYVYFPSTIEADNEQYYLYDLASVVSAVGGGLGLFLGFSCLALASKAINWTINVACSKNKEIEPVVVQA